MSFSSYLKKLQGGSSETSSKKLQTDTVKTVHKYESILIKNMLLAPM